MSDMITKAMKDAKRIEAMSVDKFKAELIDCGHVFYPIDKTPFSMSGVNSNFDMEIIMQEDD